MPFGGDKKADRDSRGPAMIYRDRGNDTAEEILSRWERKREDRAYYLKEAEENVAYWRSVVDAGGIARAAEGIGQKRSQF